MISEVAVSFPGSQDGLSLPTPANEAAAKAPSVPLYVFGRGFGGTGVDENAREAPRNAAD